MTTYAQFLLEFDLKDTGSAKHAYSEILRAENEMLAYRGDKKWSDGIKRLLAAHTRRLVAMALELQGKRA
jgi:hypothetical protein